MTFFVAKVAAQITTVPYSCDFENALERSQWMFINGSQPNQWVADTATNNGGRYSLYISNDGGASNTYNTNIASNTWACRYIALTAGMYNISYDWKAQGYSNSHYMRAYLVPYPFTGTAGSSTGFQTSGCPSGWIPIDASYPTGAIMNNQSYWQNVYISNVTVPTTGLYCLVFGWVNTAYNNNTLQPPAAVDNIQITAATCPRPENLSVRAITATGNVRVSWTEMGSATQWLLEYSTNSSFRTGVTSRFIDISATAQGQNPNDRTCDLAGFVSFTAYYFRIRSVCDTSLITGDTSMTSLVYNFRFCPNNVGCVDFSNLSGPDVLCTYGTFNNYPNYTSSYPGPYANVGIRNPNNGHGSGSTAGASHTIHTDINEKDSLTNYQLYTVPPGECASVRLGCRYGAYLCQATAYRFLVDTTSADIALVNYAVVLVDPSNPHTTNTEPRFIFEILDTNNNLISPTCGYSNINVSQAKTTWNRGIEFGYNNWVYWKDWTPIGLDLSPYHGQSIIIRITVFACGAGATNHSGYMYYTIGCTKGRITSTSCGGGSVSTTLTAPAGFNYRWYTAQNPNRVISRQRTVTVQVDSTMYYCDVSFVDDSSCHFTLSTFVSQRYPKAMFTGSMSNDSCKYRLRLVNTSRVTSDPNDTTSIGPCDSYFWDFGDGTTSTAQNPVKEYSRPGTYTVKLVARINDGECADTTIRRFTFHPPIHSHIIAPRKVCFGDTAFLRAANPNFVEYRWNTGYSRDSLYVVPDTTTEFTLVARDSLGCVDTMRATVAIANCHIYDTTCRNERYVSYGFNLPASALRNHADTTVVFERHVRSSFGVDSTTTLHLMIWDTNEYTYLDTFCAGTPYTFYGIPLTRGGIYSQRFTNQHGCDSIIYLDLHMLDRPTLELYHSYVPCFNFPVTLMARHNGDWIRWSSSPNDTSMSGYETQDTLVVRPHERTIYTAVVGLDGYECTTTANTIVNVESQLEARIQSSSNTANFDQMQVIFTDRSIDNTDRIWYLRDFNRPVGTNESYVYTFAPEDDSVTVLLVAYINGTQCYDTTHMTIPLLKDGLWVPSAFTPDDAGNPEFMVKGVGVLEYEIDIYNRQGYRVFHSADINEKWNGGLNNDKSKQCIGGMYTYRIVYKLLSQSQRTFNKVGSILLIR